MTVGRDFGYDALDAQANVHAESEWREIGKRDPIRGGSPTAVIQCNTNWTLGYAKRGCLNETYLKLSRREHHLVSNNHEIALT
jgi:hypothetical protein